jgi:DNA ligase-1
MSCPLAPVVDTWLDVRAVSGRLEKRRRMARLFERLEPADLRLAAMYLAGELPQSTTGVGWAAVSETLRGAGPRGGAPLTLADVDAALAAIAAAEGAGSNRRRLELLAALFARASGPERELLAGLLLGEIRQGALRALVIEAVAEARKLDAGALRRAVNNAGSLGAVVEAVALARDGEAVLAGFTLRPLVAVEPMLAATAGDLAAALADLGGELAAEWKLDGVRVQLHRLGDEVRVFTRSLRDVTQVSPELVAFARGLAADSFVLDGEVVSFQGDGKPLPFQDLMSQFATEELAMAAPPGRVEAFFFDLLYLDGELLTERPDRERRARLEALVGRERAIPRRIVGDVAAARAALEEAIAHGHEGLVLKALDAPYAAGRRGGWWRKLKPAHTVDLVILAAEWGHGRRQGFLSNLHLGARDPRDPDRFWMLGKTFKGLTDKMLRELTADLDTIAVERHPYHVRVRPERVVEIAFDDVLRSTRYDSGLALRFARVKRFRPDKTAAEATTIDEIRAAAGTKGKTGRE